MALISCPECNRQISDQAVSCPGCGYALRKDQTFADVLAGHRWKVRSKTLFFESLEAAFKSDGSIEGMLKNPPEFTMHKTQKVNGRWHVVGNLLFLMWDETTSDGYTVKQEVPIEITDVSEDMLKGVDKWVNLWEFERLP